jgi:hypothetical protein
VACERQAAVPGGGSTAHGGGSPETSPALPGIELGGPDCKAVGSKRRVEGDEPNHGLVEMARAAGTTPRWPWRAAQLQRAAMGASAWCVRDKREHEVPHLAAMLRVKRTEAGRQWWWRSTPTTGGRRRRRQASVQRWRAVKG